MNAFGPMILVLLLLAGAAHGDGPIFRMCCYNARRSAYYNNTDLYPLDPSTLDGTLCTDAIWNHGYIDLEEKTIRHCRINDTVCETNFQSFKRARDNMFIWMSIDGVDLQGEQRDKTKTFFLISNRSLDRKRFAENAASYLKTEGMDGLVIDWEYPTVDTGTDEIFLQLLKAINTALKPDSGVYLAAITPSDTNTIAKYNLKELHPLVNLLIIKAYDHHLATRTVLSHSSPVFSAPEDTLRGTTQNLNATLASYLSKQWNVPPNKIVIGMSWKAVVYFIETGAPMIPGSPGRLQTAEIIGSRLVQGMALDEVCFIIMQEARLLYDDRHQVPYLVYKDYWISYENAHSVAKKINLSISFGIQGVMIDDVEMDDVKGTGCENGTYPLLHTILNTIKLSVGKSAQGNNFAISMWNGVASPYTYTLHLGLWLGYLIAALILQPRG